MITLLIDVIVYTIEVRSLAGIQRELEQTIFHPYIQTGQNRSTTYTALYRLTKTEASVQLCPTTPPISTTPLPHSITLPPPLPHYFTHYPQTKPLPIPLSHTPLLLPLPPKLTTQTPHYPYHSPSNSSSLPMERGFAPLPQCASRTGPPLPTTP